MDLASTFFIHCDYVYYRWRLIDKCLASVRPLHHCLLWGEPPVSDAVMQSLNVVFDVSINKLLNKPSYDVTVMDDLALEGASLLSAHCVPVYLKQLCWHKFVDAAKTDRIKEVTYQIYVCVYNKCWHNVLFSERYRLEIGGVNPLETC